MHDFQSFSDDDPDEKSTDVLVDEVAIGEDGDLILIRVTGSHFIWKMVRRMVGVLAEIGSGGLDGERCRLARGGQTFAFARGASTFAQGATAEKTADKKVCPAIGDDKPAVLSQQRRRSLPRRHQVSS